MTTTFNSTETPAPITTPAADQAPVIEYKGKKLTVAEVLTKLEHGDTFIDTLKAERETDRKLLADAAEELKKAVNSEELLKKLSTQSSTPQTPASTEPVDIMGAVDKVISQREIAAKRQANFEHVKSELQRVYGGEIDVKVKEVCAAVGMTFEAGIELAQTAPEAFKRLFPDITKAPPAKSGVPQGNVNSAALKDQPVKSKSGYWDAKGSKEQVAAYTKRLQELSGA